MRRAPAALVCVLFLGACGGSQEQTRLGAGESSPDGGACPAVPSTVSTSPATISDAVALANALLGDQPSLSLECFVSSLSRPVKVLGTASTFSLQPGNADNPRIFLFSGSLVMSVVPTGAANNQIELAQYTTSTVRSIKAQLVFPVGAPIAAPDPYDSVRLGTGGTICGDCHTGEALAPEVTVTQAFESDVFQPLASQIVPLQKMQDDTSTCDPQQDPERCAILNSVFSHGAVTTGAFDPNARTFN
jgi:hypothetical protein